MPDESLRKATMNVMKKIIAGVTAFALALLAPQLVQAQGTMTVLSNFDQTTAGSIAVGSDSWLFEAFRTGTNPSGYVLNSIQLEMAAGSGNPSNFTVMIYNNPPAGVSPGNSIGTLNGSLNPVAGGIFTFTTASSITLSSSKMYFIVLTAGTTVANGAYEWDYTSVNSYNPNGGWSGTGDFSSSSDGSDYSNYNYLSGDYAQYAINVTDVPEPGVLGLSALGGLAFLWHHRKSKA
jgi:hypothetical protein